MQAQAVVSKRVGTIVWLLIPPAESTSTTTPFNVSDNRKAINPATCTAFKVYAKVAYKPGVFKYSEGGKTVQRLATIEIPADWSVQVVAAYAVRLNDGTVMLKKNEKVSEAGTTYILEVESYVNNINQ